MVIFLWLFLYKYVKRKHKVHIFTADPQFETAKITVIPWRNAPDVKVSFVVAGAGGEAINGRYVLVDTQNGRPRYKLEHGQAAT